MAPTRKEIAKDIFLYTVRNDNPVSFQYYLEVAKLKQVIFTLDIEGSVNFRLSSGGKSQETTVNPYQKSAVGTVVLVNPREPWQLKCQYKWLEGPPDQSVIRAIVDRDMASISAIVAAAEELHFGSDAASIQTIQNNCSKFRVNYVDTDFPPSNRSLYPPESESAKTAELVTWRRPEQFMVGKYDIFVDQVEPSDIRQGSLGDCWLLCALAALAERPDEIVRCFVTEDGRTIQTANTAGVYKVRLCINGQWQFVRLDDYFPCFPESGPVYSKSHGNELWVLLLEKAFAKVCGSYDALRGGWAYEALMDITGAPCTSYRLDDDDVRADITSGKFWNQLVAWDAAGYLMSASTPGEDKWSEGGGLPAGGPGLVSGHAYTLLQARTTSRGGKLLELRNPWGKFEWTGDWSDNSPLWTEALKAEIKPTIGIDDGAFWMSYEDFLKYFCGVNVCHLATESARWHESRLKGQFTFVAGDVTSSMYILSVSRKTQVWVGLHQADERIETSKPNLDIGVSILKEESEGRYRLVGSSGIEVSRQVFVNMTLEPGEYLVVPHTTGCKFAAVADRSGSGSVGVFDDAKNSFTAPIEAALREVFDRLDQDMDGILNRDELNSFQQMSEGCDMMDEVYHWLIDTFDSRDGGLSADGFIETYRYMFDASGKDPEIVWRDLRYMGYDEDLDLAGARSFVLSVHSQTEAGLWKIPFDPAAFEEAMELPVKTKGTVTDYANGTLRLYKLKSGYWGVSLAVENRNPVPVAFTLDCSASTNVISHTGNLVVEQVIPPGETKILHHLMPKEQAAWAWGFRASWRQAK